MRGARAWIAVGLLMALCSAPLEAGAKAGPEVPEEEAEKKKDWGINITPYAWAANIDGTIGVLDSTGKIHESTVDIIKHLHGLGFIYMDAHYKRFGVLSDIVYIDQRLSDDLENPLYPSADLSSIVLFGTQALFYRFEPAKGLTIDPYIGARWWRVDNEVSLSGGLLPDATEGLVETWADPVFGVNVHYDITKKWFTQGTVDVGGGVSKITYNLVVGGGYNFKKWFGFSANFRSLGVWHRSGGLTWDIRVNGFLAGFHFRI